MSGGKCVTLIFESVEDFKTCNKYMQADKKNIGIHASKNNNLVPGDHISDDISDRRICVFTNTGDVLIPPGTLTVKTSSGTDISIKVISGIGRETARVIDNVVYPLEYKRER